MACDWAVHNMQPQTCPLTHPSVSTVIQTCLGLHAIIAMPITCNQHAVQHAPLSVDREHAHSAWMEGGGAEQRVYRQAREEMAYHEIACARPVVPDIIAQSTCTRPWLLHVSHGQWHLCGAVL